MMFIWGEPLAARTAADVLNITEAEVKEAFEALTEEYEQEKRGIRVRRINKGYQFVTAEENGTYIERLCTPVKRRRLSQSALEVLAIVAYRQPVTKGEIEAIRGIRCDRVLEGLMNKDLVEVKGRSEAIGRPNLYGTTDAFLRYFDLADIKELPDIQDIEQVMELPEEYGDSVTMNQISLEDMAAGGASAGEAGEEPQQPEED
ncbi:MAG: SMC-Scp complex subunit ScpB [Clostridiales bacterium]|nr:SMC-Scp complex subunit ScpB [Clostridiales bacterium]